MTKEQRTIQLLTKRWLTPLESALNGGVLSLSQRVSEWRRLADSMHITFSHIGKDGVIRRYDVHTRHGYYRIQDRWVKTNGGARVKAYRLVRV